MVPVHTNDGFVPLMIVNSCGLKNAIANHIVGDGVCLDSFETIRGFHLVKQDHNLSKYRQNASTSNRRLVDPFH